MKLLFFIIKVVVITFFIASCGFKPITGRITGIEGRKVQCAGKVFLLENSARMPSVGDSVVFLPTKSRNKINSRIIKP